MTSSQEKKYQLEENGRFIISDYNSAKSFSSFFPGVAGKNGIPMWVFYVNRGQCICSMGIEDKDHPIMEFLPANWAYNLVSTQGFRTFIKFADNEITKFYEPFQNHLSDKEMQRSQRLIISLAQLTLEEVNQTLGLKFTVEYFNVPQDNYAGLVRKLQIENIKSEPVSLEGLDGLPLIIPYGIDNGGLKYIRHLVQAFVEVVNHENGVPFFKGKVKPADRPDVVRIKEGNFYLGFVSEGNESRLIKTIVDPAKIFGIRGDYNYPDKFLTSSREDMISGQIFENRLPSAMGIFNTTIQPGETYTYISIIGHAGSVKELNDLVPVITNREYIETKARMNQELVEKLTQNNFICSSEPVLDHYARQNFLDNALRGGFPYTLKGKENSSTLHLYSRKHGDLERDYNDYRLAPTHYSQGNGNFRDVNQNRRNDLFFNPDVREGNVEHFYNLIQLDGFNPLVIKEIRFTLSDSEKVKKVLSEYLGLECVEQVTSFLENSFTPGELMMYLQEQQIVVQGETEVFLGDLLGICHKNHDTGYGEGFWTDHWTYNLDLLENFLAVYPEKKNYILFKKKSFSYYDNPHRVQPRDDKYVIWDGKAMQLEAVVFDEEKDILINQRDHDRNKVRTLSGSGDVYYTTLINKILCLIVNKLASLDPEGIGIEMETGKPNWYDALNGLPGLMGSSISETLEVKRHILFLLEALREQDMTAKKWFMCEELQVFMDTLYGILKADLPSFEYWDQATAVKEIFRHRTRLGISGSEKTVTVEKIIDFLLAGLNKLEAGIEKAWNKEKNVISTYFVNAAVEYEEIKFTDVNGEVKLIRNAKGLPCFRAKKFEQRALPLFLEGPVHYLRSNTDLEQAKTLVKNIRKSGLYDHKLNMYKVNESLEDQPMEIGRARTFSPGWFENESIWLHMEYKYMLELLRNELYQEFYTDFKKVFVPFMEPAVYGRSILENSSFIVSSANPDPSIHGNGFIARLSGATAEFIHILHLMSVGAKPFFINSDNELSFSLKPALPAWLFTTEPRKSQLYINKKLWEIEFPAQSFSFMFLSNMLVTYHNPELADTFGTAGVVPVSWLLTDIEGNKSKFTGTVLTGEIAVKIRAGEIARMEIELKKSEKENIKNERY
ncbi:MAG: hypothetical protein K9N06_05750 [Candidatus Cloacimonetes bacterium]|nr:hypothetical protein [Candidatus Cloacimonadota bacterium]